MTLAVRIRELSASGDPPLLEARHPDHYRCGEIGFEACFLAD